MKFLALASAFFAVARAATAKPGPSKVREYTLDIVNAQAAPDGHVRSIVSANGTFPGPLIKANKGDTLRIHMNNKLTDPTMRRSTTLDFDGLFFDEKNVFSEGTPWVTTCPIGPGGSYTYEIPLGDQTGTYWYHSQLSLQYTDGLRGPLIIYDPDDPHKDLYDFDDENTIWFLSDWWHNSTIPMLELYRATQVIPVADGGLLNGAGRFNTGPLVPYDVTNVKSGKRYRMRIICANTRNDMILSIDNHDMTIIAADGVPTVPHTIHQMDILAGQRYDVIVTANQPVANYWINAIMGGGNRARNPNLNVTLSRGVLHYEGAPNAEPTTPMTNGTGLNVLDEGDLRPLFPEVPPPFDIELTFLTSMTVNKTEWNINNISYISPDSPTLVRMIDGTGNDQSDYAVSENTFVLPRNKVVQVNFPPSTEDELHPFHLHGSNFWAIKANASAANEINPIRRDVLGAGAGGTTVRFRTDKVGPWFFHCHIFWHLSAGLASVMAVDPADASKTIHPTAAWDSLCDAYDALPEDEK